MGMSKRKSMFLNSTVTDDADGNASSLCLCLSLAGSDSCRFPSHCTKKRKLVHQDNNIRNAAAVVPVARRPRNWGYSTAMVLYDDPWKIKKVLTQSDVGNNCNILINKEMAKDLIVPVLGGREVCENRDVRVRVWDSDTDSLHSLVFTVRPSNNSHVFKDTWVNDFVIRRNLQVGDQIGLIWDRYNQRFVFSVLRAYHHHHQVKQH